MDSKTAVNTPVQPVATCHSAAPRAAVQSGRALGLVLLVIAVGVGAYLWLPGFATKVDDKIEKLGGWNEEARRHDPVKFIDYSITKLTDNVAKFGEVKGSLALAKAKLQKLHDDYQGKLSFAGKELDNFKTAFKEASGGKGWPTTIAGRAYSEAELKAQVNSMLNERAAFENVLKQTLGGLETTGKREMELGAQIVASKAKLTLLKAQKELVKVNQLTAETETLLGQVNDVLVENEALQAENPVRTVEELMKQAESGSATSNANVDAFLNG